MTDIDCRAGYDVDRRDLFGSARGERVRIPRCFINIAEQK